MQELIQVEFQAAVCLNAAMQQNHLPVIHRLHISAQGEPLQGPLTVSLKSEPAFAQPWSCTVETLQPGEHRELTPVSLQLSGGFFRQMTEEMPGEFLVEVTDGERVLAQARQSIQLLPVDQWPGIRVIPELAAAFVTPNQPVIGEILRDAGRILEKWRGEPSFIGYQGQSAHLVRLQMAAIYGALQQQNIGYCMPPASFGSGQRVRFCDSLLKQQLGTCLDLTFLYLSCLEAAGLHGMLVLHNQHAYAACWLEEQCFPECVQDDFSVLTKRVAQGVEEIAVVECTAFTARQRPLSFDEACAQAEKHFQEAETFALLVDIWRSRLSGIRPLSLIAEEPAYASVPREQREPVEQAPQCHPEVEKVEWAPVEISRQQLWERKLLDLSLRNTLINFRLTRSAVQLLASDLSALEDALSSGQDFQIFARPKDLEGRMRDSRIFELEEGNTLIDHLLQQEFSQHRIRCWLEERELKERITYLYRQARVSLEENGANTLYLALGLLRWYESEVSEKPRHAPLVLLPVNIVRKSAQNGYLIRLRDEDPQMNITLLEMLRQDFGLTIGGLDPLPTDEQGVDLKRVFSVIRQAVMSHARWDVEELAFFGLFSFSQFIMWNDIRNRAEDLARNPVVNSLMAGHMTWTPAEDFPAPEKLDDQYAPADLAVPLSTDSSQLSAICAAGQGSSFVLHGPPGTGKSQTITNLIANALFQGKSVLFVAEKMAALSVVQRRLSQVGIGPFCLELHSNKARKKDVLNQLEQVLEIGRARSPEQYTAQADRLLELRQGLNQQVRQMHQLLPGGFTLYEAITRFEQRRQQPDCVRVPAEQLAALTAEGLTARLDALAAYRAAAEACGGPCGHPLSGIADSRYSQGKKVEIADALEQLTGLLTRRQALLKELAPAGVPVPPFVAKRQAFCSFAGVLAEVSSLPAPLFLSEVEQLAPVFTQLIQTGRQRDRIRSELLKRFQQGIFSLNAADLQAQWNQLSSRWLLPRLLGQGRLCKLLGSYGPRPAAEEMPALLQQLVDFQGCQRQLETSQLTALLQPWDSESADWDQLEKQVHQARELRRLLAESSTSPQEQQQARQFWADMLGHFSDFRSCYQQVLSELAECGHKLETSLRQVTALTGMDTDVLSEQLTDEGLLARAAQWQQHLDGLRDWCSYLAHRQELVSLGLEEVAVCCEDGRLKPEQALPAWERAVYLGSAGAAVEGSSVLSSFNGRVFEEQIDRYRSACGEFEALTRQELAARLSARIPAAVGGAASSEIAILQRAIRSGGRGISIRRLFDSIPNLLRKLCPCMLMSPISVAQYIDPAHPAFDLVVFDEASQLPTCEAVGAIARGESVVVVGDPKQLPPTSFFNPNRIDEDNFEQEDLESILDDCLALSMPQLHLLWHYRSRHESLIAFSNQQFYDNKLLTFPSPNDLESEVRLVQLDGYYDRGHTKQNQAEAQAVVAEITRRLADPACQDSIGVVTFSTAQQNLIEDLLLEAYAAHPEWEERAVQAAEPLFIKNLENVQGDERDVILFSVGYGPDEQGRVALNFGPLNRDGGWRRLNVAVTRARKEMVVYSVLRPEQLDLSRTRAAGVAGLKAFLEFARDGKRALSQFHPHMEAENMASLIARGIAELGYDVRTDIGCSAYQMDIGVVDPRDPHRYLLGIMLDGARYAGTPTARDRNLSQTGVLEGLGWEICRIWLLDWWENPQAELGRIQELLQQLLQKPLEVIPAKTPAEAPLPPAVYEEPEPAVTCPDNCRPYMPVSLKQLGKGADDFCQSQHNRMILEQLGQVMEEEAPISRKLLSRRLLGAWKITRAGARLERRLDELAALADLSVTCEGDHIFYWKNGEDAAQYEQFRIARSEEERREMEDIPAQEIAAAIHWILQNQLSLSKEDLIREVGHVFGFARMGSSIEEGTARGLAHALDKQWAVLDGERICLQES